MKIQTGNQHIHMTIGLLTLYFQLPGCHSLKEKRSIIKSITAKTQREFFISMAEIGFQDKWQESLLACVIVSNDTKHNQSLLQNIAQQITNKNPNIILLDHRIEFF